MPKVGKEHKESRKTQILLAAVECFGDQGFHQTSMRDICKKADLSIGAVYNYFDSKEDIIETMAEKSRNSAKSLFQDIKETDSRNQAIQKILHQLVKTLAYQKENNQLNMKVHFWSEALRSEKIKLILKENLSDIIAKVLRNLESHTTNKNNYNLTNEQIAILILSIYQGLTLQLVIENDVNFEQTFETLSILLTNQNL